MAFAKNSTGTKTNMDKFLLKHPTKPDFWVTTTSVCLDNYFFQSILKLKIPQVEEEMDFFLKRLGYKQGVKTPNLSNASMILWLRDMPVAFGADAKRFSKEFTNLQTEIIDPINTMLEYNEHFVSLMNIIKNLGIELPHNITNPFSRATVWKKTLKDKSFNMVNGQSEDRLYSSSTYALLWEDSGYFSNKADYKGVPLSEATTFDSLLLAQRQKNKLYPHDRLSIVELEVKFKKVIEVSEAPTLSNTITAYKEKAGLDEMLNMHSIDDVERALTVRKNKL